MKMKLFVLVVAMLMCLSAIVIIPSDFEVEATGGGGGGNGEDNGIGLDFDFMWEITENLSNVVHNTDIYQPGTIPRGRTWGTDGDRWTANYTRDIMKYRLDLTGVKKLLIEYLDKPDHRWKHYSSKVEVKDFKITINNASDVEYPWEQQMPTSEIFVIPQGMLPVNFNKTYNNVAFRKMFDPDENRVEPWPFAGTYNNFSLNLTETGNEYEMVIGNVSYINISNNETVPEEHDGMVFMIDDVENETQDRIDNMTNASGCIIIHDNSIGPDHANT